MRYHGNEVSKSECDEHSIEADDIETLHDEFLEHQSMRLLAQSQETTEAALKYHNVIRVERNQRTSISMSARNTMHLT